MDKYKYLLARLFKNVRSGSRRSIAMILAFVMLFSSITVTGNDILEADEYTPFIEEYEEFNDAVEKGDDSFATDDQHESADDEEEIPEEEIPKEEIPKVEILKEEIPKGEILKEEIPKEEIPEEDHTGTDNLPVTVSEAEPEENENNSETQFVQPENPAAEVVGVYENIRFLLTFPEVSYAEDGAWLLIEKIHPDSIEYRSYTAAVKEGIDARREEWAVVDGDFYSVSLVQPDGRVTQLGGNSRMEIIFPADSPTAMDPDHVRTVFFREDIFEEKEEKTDVADKTTAPSMTKQVKDDGLHITFDLDAIYALGVMKTLVPDGTPIEYLVPAEEDLQTDEGLMPADGQVTDDVEVVEDSAESYNADENAVQPESQNEVSAEEVIVPEEGIIPEESEVYPEALGTDEQWEQPAADEGFSTPSFAEEDMVIPDEAPLTEMLPEEDEEESKPEQNSAPEDEVLLSSDDEESFPEYEGAAGSQIVPVEGANYEIRVDYTAEAGIPAEAGFEAKAITEEDKDEWLKYGSVASRAVILSQDMSADEADNLVIRGIFDLTIFDPAGRVIEPKAPVHVSVGFAEAEGAQSIIDAYAVHFPGTGMSVAGDTIYEEGQEAPETSDGEILEESVSVQPQAVGAGSNNPGLVPEVIPAGYENGSVDFYAGGFSVYVVVCTTLEQTLTITGNYGDQGTAVGASTTAGFTLPVTVQPATVPASYGLGSGMTLSVVKPHNVKVSVTSANYDAANGTITYTAVVEAESEIDEVNITDLTEASSSLQFESGSYLYARGDVPEGAPAAQVNSENVTPGTSAAFDGFPVTVTNMLDGDTITLTYTAKVLKGSYNKDTQQTEVQNTVTISNNDPTNNPDDDSASVTTTVPYTPLTREYVSLSGSWAYWEVTVNPDGYTLNGGSALTLEDTFDDKAAGDAEQSIDYTGIAISGSGVTYDYSGSTGTFVIPDNTPVTITYRTRVTAQPGEAVTFRGTAVLKDTEGNTIASATAGAVTEAVVIYPSASDVTGSDYMVRLYVYGENAMQQGIAGATFILLDANQRPLEYKAGTDKGRPVTFTTGSDGYVNIELPEDGGVSIEKNTGYYLEMKQAVDGYQKDNTLYSFMITDDPTYETGGFYQYYNGDTMKVRLYPSSAGLSVSIRFSGSYALREDRKNNVTAVLQMLDENNNWVEVERHPYTDAESGTIRFDEALYNAELADQNIYRVVEENESPWDLPEDISLTTRYYCLVNAGESDPHTEPQEFWADNPDDSVSVVIDNRYEEPQLTIVKMDKHTGEDLPGAVFSVYKIVNGAESGEAVTTYTTDENGEIVIRGGESFESETLYGFKETAAPEHYLLPLKEEWHYFYFCNDEYLEQSILANLPEDATAINLTNSGDRITVDNQKETVTIPVMKLWQGDEQWPENAEVKVGLYQSVDGSAAEPVLNKENTPLTAILTSAMPYNNTAFSNLPSRDIQGRNIVYSIKEESINGIDPLEARYVPEYGISGSGVYIVRNKPAATLTVSKQWVDLSDNPVTDIGVLAAQSSVTFDVYRSSTRFTNSDSDDGITNDEMTAFVSTLTRARENLSFGASDGWELSINDLDKQNDRGNPYYYYVLETVPSFGSELYEVDEDAGTVKIKNKIAPETVNLTVTKAALGRDPRPESLDRDFSFTLKLKVDDTHPVRSWQVYTDTEHPENNLITDWNGEATFKLKPTNPATQPTEGASITLALPVGVTVTLTEAYNPEYTVETSATVTGTTSDNNRTFSYDTEQSVNVTLTYTNTLHVVCKVVDDNGEQTPFESLRSALTFIRSNPDNFTSPWTIYMLEDYTIPSTDGIELAEGESLTLTTASTDDQLFPFKGGEEADRAVITRGEAGDSMLKNAGTLTLEKICLDGGDITAIGDGGLVNSIGTLNLNDKATLRNSATSGKGGAVYAEGTVNIADGAEITGSSAPSASALYMKGTLNMTGGKISDNTGVSDGAVVVESTGDLVNLSGNPVIIDNTNTQGKAANLFIGVDSDNVVNVVNPGLAADAQIGVTAMDGHMLIGEQFATAEFEQTANLNRFVNDVYGYSGKLKDGTSTNVVWDGLTVTIKKVVDPLGANPNDRFTITLSSLSIVMSTYVIDGTLDYTVTAARQSRPGRITLRNVKADDDIKISPLPVGEYTITEVESNYTPGYTLVETGSTDTPAPIEGGTFTADNDSTVTVTNTRKLASVKLTKTLDDRLATAAVDFPFTVKLTDADGTAVADFTLAEGVTTDANGVATFTMSPTDADNAIRSLLAPVGAAMTVTETVDPNYRITASAKTMPAEGEGAAITDADTDSDNVFAFTVTEDGADVTFDNVRKMAEIELSKTLTGKVSKTESFTFTLTLTNGAAPVANYIVYRDETNPENNITTNDSGVATIPFTFVENETEAKSIPLTIPEGTKLVVAETEVKKNVNGTEQPIYTTTYSVNGGSAVSGTTVTINAVSDADKSIAFTNTRKTQTITVTNTVAGYAGNVVPFTYTATVTDGGENQDDYDLNGFTDGVMTFELTTGQSQTLTVPYGATLTVAETFIVGYGTTVKRGSVAAVEALSDTFVVTADVNPLLFTNSQLIGLRIVNNTSSTLENVKITVGKNNIYLVNEDQTGQERISSNKTATISVEAGKTAILEIQHDTSVTAEQNYTVSGTAPADGYYYTINNEPSFHEFADPAILRVYNTDSYVVKGKLRYSVNDSTVTFTEQPLVSFDSNGGSWTTEMDGYHDPDGNRKVYQKAVNSGETVARPTPDPVYPTAEGIAFLGWTTDETFAKQAHTESEDISAKLYDFENTLVTTPFTLYAIWARDPNVRTVTVKNGLDTTLTVTVTLTNDDPSGAYYTLYEDTVDSSNNITTDASGAATFTLAANETRNLHVPDGAKLVISGSDGIAYSSDYTDTDSVPGSFTIDSVQNDGTVSFIDGIFKITDAAGNLLYDANGRPAIYGNLRKTNNANPDEAFDAYEKTLYTDAAHTTPAPPAAVKQLVDEYTIPNTAAIAFPNMTMTLTTAGKDDTDFPYVGVRDRATIYRSTAGANANCFTLASGNITLTDIILDGGSEQDVKVAAGKHGGLINMTNGTLNVSTGTTLRNVVYANYSTASYGGAIYMNNGTLNVSAGLFSNLHACQGGAIYAITNAQVNIEGTDIRFENCCTEATGDGDGGAIYYSVSKALTINGGSSKDNPGIIFDSCVARGSTGSGGAIYAATSGNQPVSVSGCSFVECSARTTETGNVANGGGAICANNVSAFSASACRFTACDTLSRGGAFVVWVKNGGEVSTVDSTFERCNCKGQGGGIAVYQPKQEDASVPKETDARALTKLSVNACEFSNCSSGTNNGSGGAIQCYLPRMEFTDSTFTDCWAGKEGGAVNNYFGNGYTVVWPGTYMNMTGCTFIRCRAEDRYDPTALQHYGGAMNTKVKTVTVTDSYFEDCVSTLKEGGALHLGGQGGDSTATITGSTFKNCTAKNGGGALLSSHETLTIENSNFYGCESSASNGGAVYHYRNSRGVSTQKYTTITGCTFGAYPDDSDSLGCSAANNGGAIWTRATTDVKLENLTIENATAGNYGGGVYLDTGVTKATITDGSIKNCRAVSGSAVYVGKNATFSGDLEVSGNAVSNVNSGAIQTVNAGTLYFEGNVVVEDNTCSADSTYDHDVLMQINGNTIINTTSVGLDSGAGIGVYVSDPNSAYANHGKEGQAFGTYGSSNYLDAFFNNRNGELYGCQMSASDTKIYWGNYVCKITDADGNTLTRPDGRDAVYQRLSQALDEFTLVTGGSAVYIKMLIEDYTIRQTDAISNFPAADITLTTASASDVEHPYRGTKGTVCTISRTSGKEQLFRLNNADATFRLEGITLDGRNDKSTETGNRRLIEAVAGKLVVNGGTTLQYGAAGNGGAIDAAVAAQVTVNGVYDSANKEPTVKFINCTATGNNSNRPNGGAIRAYNLNITNSSEETGEFGTAFINCSAYNGGAITSLGSSMEINGVFFDACQTQSSGGAVYHNYSDANSTSTFKNCAFENCVTNGNTTWAHGGAIEARTAELSVEDCSFKNCSATSDGGAVYHGYVDGNNKPSGNREKTTIKNTTFDGCSTTGSDTAYNYGGSVYTQAKTVEVIDSSFKDSIATNHGGALYCQCSVDGSAATISGTSFTNCASSRSGGYGGAIYSRNAALTLQKSSKSETSISNCTAPGYSGAVHMETSGSVLNIKDSTVISACYANKGGAVYLPAGVTMNLTDSPEFSRNGYTTQNGSVVNASEGACIYLAEGSRINLKDSPKFSRNILPNLDRITNGGILDFVRQDIYLAGYASSTPFDTNAASIYVLGELTGDIIWVWPEQSPHRLPNEQFAKIAGGVTVTPESLSKLRNALADTVTNCSNGEYLAGVQVGTDAVNVYWDKMYVVSFMKKDNKGIAVPGAGFTLYSDSDCTIPVATAKSADGENDTDAQGTLLAKGMVEFTSIRIGAYYMKETDVPSSFKENNTTYLVLVGTPYLKPNDNNRYLWENGGPLGVSDAATLVQHHTTEANKYYGIFPLDANGKAVLRANLASSNVGIENIRNDYQVSFMKVDSSGNALPGAAFTIYSAILNSSGQPDTFEDGYPKLMLWSRDGENYPEPVVSADGTAKFKDKDNKTLPKGMVYFRELPLGTYYLLETAYPERNGSGRYTFYAESDRGFKLELEEDTEDATKVNVTLSEWKPATESSPAAYEELTKDTQDRYVVSNREVVCKLTDANDNLLYVEGHQVWENKEDSSIKRFPAIYSTLEEGFAAAQSGSFVDANGNPVTVDALKLKVLKDFSLSEPVIYNSARAITFTTAETKASEKDRYVFSTTRTSDTSRAHITRAYDADTSADANAGALITLAGGAKMTLQNIEFNGQKTSYNGRALHVTDGSELNILNNTRIENFKQESASGGAILLDDGTGLTIDGGYNRTADFRRNTGTYGGAIAVGTGCTVSITNARFSSNQANNQGSGGAIYAGGNANVTVKDSSVTGNTAGLGSAVFAEDQAAVTISGDSITGCSITGNTAGGSNGGAINVGGSNARLYFGGNVTVFDNYGSLGQNQQTNLVLSVDYNDVINTTTGGLLDGTIGVFVIESDSTVFENHGLPGKPFGTFGDAGRVNPQVFRSDHALALYGTRNESDPSDILIYWVDVICKLTDDNDKILYQNISLNISGNQETHKAQAVYARITDYGGTGAAANGFNVLIDGFDAAQGTLYSRNGNSYTAYPNTTGTVVKLKMLKDYNIDKSIRYHGRRMVTFTTAETGNPTDVMRTQGDYFCFKTDRTDANGKALITRAFGGDPMIVDTGTALTLTNITLDGAAQNYISTADGGIVNVASGSALTVAGGATLQNSASTGNGGAVYVAANAAATVSGGTINGNTAANGAGIYLTQGSKLYLSGNPSFNNNVSDATLPDDAKNGGEEYKTARQDIYLAGTADEGKALTSISLSDNLDNTVKPGSIWVWAEGDDNTQPNHYYMLKQFAVLADSFTGKVTDSTYQAFRNARADEDTDCGGDYLTGQAGDDIDGTKCIYWTGGYDISLMKVDGFGEPLAGAEFTLYTEYKSKTENTPYQKGGETVKATSSDGKTSADFPDPEDPEKVQAKGTILFPKIAPKTYYMIETDTPEGYVKDETIIYRLTIASDGTPTVERKLLTEDDDDYTEASKVQIKEATETEPAEYQYRIMNNSDVGRKVILRKVAKDKYTPLAGAEFRIFRADLSEITDTDFGYDTAKKCFVSLDSGVYFIGMLPEGKYYLVEITVPDGAAATNKGKVFTLEVKDGMVRELPGSDTDKINVDDKLTENLQDWVLSQPAEG